MRKFAYKIDQNGEMIEGTPIVEVHFESAGNDSLFMIINDWMKYENVFHVGDFIYCSDEDTYPGKIYKVLKKDISVLQVSPVEVGE